MAPSTVAVPSPSRRDAVLVRPTRTAAGRPQSTSGGPSWQSRQTTRPPTGFADKIVNITGQPDDIVHAVAQIVGRLRNWQGVAHHDPAVFVALAPPSVVAAIAHERRTKGSSIADVAGASIELDRATAAGAPYNPILVNGTAVQVVEAASRLIALQLASGAMQQAVATHERGRAARAEAGQVDAETASPDQVRQSGEQAPVPKAPPWPARELGPPPSPSPWQGIPQHAITVIAQQAPLFDLEYAARNEHTAAALRQFGIAVPQSPSPQPRQEPTETCRPAAPALAPDSGLPANQAVGSPPASTPGSAGGRRAESATAEQGEGARGSSPTAAPQGSAPSGPYPATVDPTAADPQQAAVATAYGRSTSGRARVNAAAWLDAGSTHGQSALSVGAEGHRTQRHLRG